MEKQTERRKQYLEEIFKIESDGDIATVKGLAHILDVAPPSVSQMLSRLRTAGFVVSSPRHPIALTGKGRREGGRVLRRHRISERFLADYLELPWDQVHAEACKFEHVLTEEVEARLAERLGNPTTCPHGNTIPSADGVLEEPASRPLAELVGGEQAVIARISDEEPDVLRTIASLGLLPETRIAVQAVVPCGGPSLVQVAGRHYAVSRDLALKIHVHTNRSQVAA